MAIVVGFLTLIVSVGSVLMCATNARRRVLTSFVIFSTVSYVIWGIMDQSGLLPYGKTWSFLDAQLLALVVIAYPFSRQNVLGRPHSGVDTAMLILVCLAGLNLLVGVIRPDTTQPLNVLRRFMTLPLYFAAANILSTPTAAKRLYRAVMWFVIPVFLLQISFSFRVFELPLAQIILDRVQREQGGAEFYRPWSSIWASYYVISLSVAICHILYARGVRKLFPWVVVVLSAVGILLTQARSMYLGAFLVVLGLLLFSKGRRLGTVVLAGLGAIVLFVVMGQAAERGIDLLYRFRTGTVRAETYWYGWRGSEFRSLYAESRQRPQFVLTGHGFGATHLPVGTPTRVTFFHNDYLTTLFSLGLVGFACWMYVLAKGVFGGHKYRRERDICLILMPARVALFAVGGTAFFMPDFWVPLGLPLVICLLAIARNGDYMAESMYGDYEAYPEAAYGGPIPSLQPGSAWAGR